MSEHTSPAGDQSAPADTSVENEQQADRPSPPQQDQPVGMSNEPAAEEKQLAVVRYGLMRHIGQFKHNLDFRPKPGVKVVARTDRGVELGTIVAAVSDSGCAG